MGTTADKLNKILQTKEAIRQSIIGKGVDVTSSDTFASYSAKIDSIKASGGSAEYVYIDTQSDVTYPKKTMTADEWLSSPQWFDGNLDGFRNSKDDFSLYVRISNYNDLANLFDNNLETYCQISDTNYGIRFKSPVVMKQVGFRPYSDARAVIYATDDPANFGNKGAMEVIGDLSNEDSTKMTYFNLSQSKPYQYYTIAFEYIVSSPYVSEMRFIVTEGAKKLALKSSNMTPAIDYTLNPAEVTTQEFFDGSKVISSKKLLFKPYDEGGALLDYTDDRNPVNLNLLLCKGSYQLPKGGIVETDNLVINRDGSVDSFGRDKHIKIKDKIISDDIKFFYKFKVTGINQWMPLLSTVDKECTLSVKDNSLLNLWDGSDHNSSPIFENDTLYWIGIRVSNGLSEYYVLKDNGYNVDTLPDFAQWNKQFDSSVNMMRDKDLIIGYSYFDKTLLGVVYLDSFRIYVDGSLWLNPYSETEIVNFDDYFLAQDENITLPAGFNSKTKVGGLSLPDRNKTIILPPALEPTE